MTYIKHPRVILQTRQKKLAMSNIFPIFAWNSQRKISNNRRTKGVPHKRRKDNIMLTFGIVTIVAAVIAEALIVSKKINLD